MNPHAAAPFSAHANAMFSGSMRSSQLKCLIAVDQTRLQITMGTISISITVCGNKFEPGRGSPNFITLVLSGYWKYWVI